jgi:hypothetical protein
MKTDSIWDLYIWNNRETMRELICDVLSEKITKKQFWKEYNHYERLEQKYEDCWKFDLKPAEGADEIINWRELEKRGLLCDNDYTEFNLNEKYGMTREEGKSRYKELLEGC